MLRQIPRRCFFPCGMFRAQIDSGNHKVSERPNTSRPSWLLALRRGGQKQTVVAMFFYAPTVVESSEIWKGLLFIRRVF